MRKTAHSEKNWPTVKSRLFCASMWMTPAVVVSLNCIAEMLSGEHDEIIFVDYNTPNDVPTFIEAIYDTLTPRARRVLRVLRVRPEVHHRLYGTRTHLAALEAICRNIGVRRSNPQNRWILSTNTDMISFRETGSTISRVP